MTLNKGVNVVEGQGYSPIPGVATNVSAILGNFKKGPVNKATLVGDLAQFQSIFGTEAPAGTTSYQSVVSFFKNAGSAPLYVVRIASDSADSASLTVQDRNGTPANTLKIEGKTPGAWANGLQVELKDDNWLSTIPAADVNSGVETAALKSVTNLEIGSFIEFDNGTAQEIVQLTGVNADSKTVSWSGGLTNAYPAASSTVKSQEFEIVVYENGFQVESWPNLSMVDTVSNFCETVVNHTTKGSKYIKATDLKASDTDEKDMPAVTAKTSLSGGADGLDDVEGADYEGVQADKTGIYALDEVTDLFRFCVPNPKLTDVDVAAAYASLVQACIDYAENRKTITFYADIPAAKTPTEAITFGDAFESRHASLWYPWITVDEVDIPPSSFVLGASVRKDASLGVFWNVGNQGLNGVDGLEYSVTKTEDNTLNEANINTIMYYPGKGIVAWGGRTKSAVVAWRFINDSELWNYIARMIDEGAADIVYRPINAETMGTVKRKLDGLGSSLLRKGAINSYEAVCNDEINPVDQTSQGILHATFTYGKPGAAEKFVVTLTSTTNVGTEVA